MAPTCRGRKRSRTEFDNVPESACMTPDFVSNKVIETGLNSGDSESATPKIYKVLGTFKYLYLGVLICNYIFFAEVEVNYSV